MPVGVDPRAVRVMAEAGVDISGARSKHFRELLGMEFDYVITLCDFANAACPVFPGNAQMVHHGFDDPPSLALAAGGDEEALEIYRRVRDEIKQFVRGLPDNLDGQQFSLDMDFPSGE